MIMMIIKATDRTISIHISDSIYSIDLMIFICCFYFYRHTYIHMIEIRDPTKLKSKKKESRIK